MDSIEGLRDLLRDFAKARDWDKFHTPKNLAMAIAGETGELIELFQWLKEEESTKDKLTENTLNRVKEEIADVFLYLLRLSDKLEIDIIQAAYDKISINDEKYPVEIFKGIADKYNQRNE